MQGDLQESAEKYTGKRREKQAGKRGETYRKAQRNKQESAEKQAGKCRETSGKVRRETYRKAFAETVLRLER